MPVVIWRRVTGYNLQKSKLIEHPKSSLVSTVLFSCTWNFDNEPSVLKVRPTTWPSSLYLWRVIYICVRVIHIRSSRAWIIRIRRRVILSSRSENNAFAVHTRKHDETISQLLIGVVVSSSDSNNKKKKIT